MEKKVLLKNIVVVIVAFAVYKLMGTFCASQISDNVVKLFATEIVFVICSLCAAFFTNKLGEIKFSSKGFGKGFFVGLFVFVAAILRGIFWIVNYINGKETITVSALAIVLFIISMLFVGIAEEMLFRGILLNGFLDFFGEITTKSLRMAIFFSSLVFGLLHIFNVTTGATLVGAVMQAINAIALGMVFGAIYVRSGKNIWSCIILHGFHDLASFINSGILRGASTSDAISGYDMSLLPSVLGMFLLALFLMRKKKLQ